MLTYFHGDAAELTDETEEIGGAKFYVAVLIEGHRKGDRIIVPSAQYLAARKEQAAQDWRDEQDAFRRLREIAN